MTDFRQVPAHKLINMARLVGAGKNYTRSGMITEDRQLARARFVEALANMTVKP